MALSRMKPSFRASDILPASSVPASRTWVSPSRSRFVPSAPPPAGPCGGTLFRAYRTRSPAPVGAGAVCAPDCACAREPRRRAHVSPRFLGDFFAPAPARTARRPPDGRPDRLNMATIFPESSSFRNYYGKLRTGSFFRSYQPPNSLASASGSPPGPPPRMRRRRQPNRPPPGKAGGECRFGCPCRAVQAPNRNS